jgi:hypothetical protein
MKTARIILVNLLVLIGGLRGQGLTDPTEDEFFIKET